MADSKLEFYYFPASFYTQKAWFALEEKGIPYSKHLILLPWGETTAPRYMRINQNGSVPALKHGDVIQGDSQDIIQYLEETFPGGKCMLLPPVSQPGYRAKVVNCQKRLDSLYIEILSYGSFQNPHFTKNREIPSLFANRMAGNMQKKAGTGAIEKLESYAAANPDLKEAYEAKIRSVKKKADDGFLSSSGITSAVLERELNHARVVLQEMEEMLERNKQAGRPDHWLCGPDFTEADLILAVTLNRFRFVGFTYLWDNGKLPNIEQFFVRVQQRLAFKKVCNSTATLHVKLLYVFGHKAKYVEALAVLLAAGAVTYAGYYLYEKFIQ